MTATPIPRSLALAMYGDLELSVIDELPPGRTPIKTAVRASTQLERIYRFVEDEIATGAQVYVVYPIIEESEKLNLKPLKQGFESIRKRFPDRQVAMLHGRMSAADKEATMQRFKAGEIEILVSTTVIEVGIDVPNASIMLIMDADRFGLSQLHQLRGRVGRGERKSYCILVSDKEKDRLDLFAETRDGFEVAERDLQLRGPGEFLGTRQSGALRFRMGNIVRDHRFDGARTRHRHRCHRPSGRDARGGNRATIARSRNRGGIEGLNHALDNRSPHLDRLCMRDQRARQRGARRSQESAESSRQSLGPRKRTGRGDRDRGV